MRLVERKVAKKTCRGIEQIRAGRRKGKPFLFQKKTQKKYSSSLKRQSSETKANTILALLLCLEF